MKANILYLTTLSLLLNACAAQKGGMGSAGNKQNGLSFETAIVIYEQHEQPGIAAEYTWVRNHYPRYRPQSQALVAHNQKQYDRLHIVSESGDEKDIYFDVTQFLGKL